jgi:hypothetical protein
MSKKTFQKETKSDSLEKKYSVTYKLNSSTEIIVGGVLLKFVAHKRNPVYPENFSNGVPESIVNHKDFLPSKKYFVVTEI